MVKSRLQCTEYVAWIRETRQIKNTGVKTSWKVTTYKIKDHREEYIKAELTEEGSNYVIWIKLYQMAGTSFSGAEPLDYLNLDNYFIK
jgi:hypothetical protein